MGPEEKKKYEDMAAEDKLRYKKDMASYTPPASAGKSPGKSAKKKKDPNAPKRATTSFFAYSMEMRPKIKEENPDISFGDLGKKIGEMFRNLSAEEKEKYEAIAAKDKERYAQEMKAYKAGQSKQKSTNGSDDDDSDGLDDAGDDSDSD